MKIAVVAGEANSLLRFRRPLIEGLVRLGHSVVCCAPDISDGIGTQLHQLGVAHHEIPLNRVSMNPRTDAKLLIHLARFFAKQQFDLVFSYTVKPVVFGMLAAKAAGVPRRAAMITGLGYAFTDVSGIARVGLNHLVRQLYKTALLGVDRVVFQNPDDRSCFDDLGLIENSTVVTVVNGSGVNIQQYDFTPPTNDEVRFVFVGRLLREKGLIEFVRAAEIVKASIPEAKFDVIGPPDPSPGGIGLDSIAELGASGTVKFHGARDDVLPFLKRALCFVLPSYREGTPRSVLEAMAVGRAVVTTDVPGCRQTTIDGETGLLVPPKNVDALADAMKKIGTNPLAANKMGRVGRKRIVDHYDDTSVAEATISGIGIETIRGEPEAPKDVDLAGVDRETISQ